MEYRHPYVEFEDLQAWRLVDRAIDDLVENQDLEELTPRHYIVGYIVKMLAEANALARSDFERS